MPIATMVPDPAWLPLDDTLGGSRDTSGELVYAIGDIHGCYAQFKALLAMVARDADSRAAGRRPILILCGDYVDRGPKSAHVLEAIVWLRRHALHDIHALMGNHESGLIDFIDRPDSGAGWLKFGADQTLRSYGVTPPAEPTPAELARARDDLLDRMPAAHLALLRELELAVEIGDYVFVHAGIRPRRPLAEQTRDDLLWIRREFLTFADPHPKIVVHGHTWVDEHPQAASNRIGIDTGSYATGVLTALRLDGGRADYVQAGEDAAA